MINQEDKEHRELDFTTLEFEEKDETSWEEFTGYEEAGAARSEIEGLLYKDIGKAQIKLTGAQQGNLISDIQGLKGNFQTAIFSIPEIQRYFIDYWLNLYELSDNGVLGSSTTKMMAMYNTSKKGYNQQLKVIFDKAMLNARIAHGEGRHDEAAKHLQNAGLHTKIFFSNDVIDAIKRYSEQNDARATKAVAIYEEIQRDRETLLKGVLMMVYNATLKAVKDLTGLVITPLDVYQQGVQVAYEATLSDSYDPSKGFYPTKWSSYLYIRVFREMQKYIQSSTRTVPVPRSRGDRYTTIAKALEKTEENNLVEITKISNEILENQRERKLTNSELFTEAEVSQLLQDFSNNFFPIPGGYKDPSILQDEELDAKEAKTKFRKILKRHIYPPDWEIVKYRWGLTPEGKCYNLEQTFNLIRKEFPLEGFTKENIKIAEEAATDVVKRLSNDREFKEIYEVIIGK